VTNSLREKREFDLDEIQQVEDVALKDGRESGRDGLRGGGGGGEREGVFKNWTGFKINDPC